MSIIYFPFDAGAGADSMEDRWYKMARLWRDTGVVAEGNKFEVYADNSGLRVKVKSGIAWIRGHYIESDAEEILAIGAADPSNPRIDRVVLRVDWSANTIALTVLQGTAAGSPSAPALTQVSGTTWEISLAQVLVDAAAASITAGKVTDERGYTESISDHAAVSVAVHGLPASVHVLGNRNAAGEFIQHGTKKATGDQARSITRGCIEAITFPVAFNSTPVVLPGGTTDNKCHLGSARAVTTTGFSLERFSTASELVNNMQWLALGS